jgi:hypothetical protein
VVADPLIQRAAAGEAVLAVLVQMAVETPEDLVTAVQGATE